MFKRENKSTPAPSTSAARAGGLGPVELAWCMTALFLLSSCAEFGASVQLLATFETDPLGERDERGVPKSDPPSSPAPTPPNDDFVWRTWPFFTAIVEAHAPAPYTGGKRWVRVQPLPKFTSSRDDRRVFLIANTAPFTNSPPTNIRGEVRLRLYDSETATVGIGFRPSGPTREHFIGGI